MASYHRLFYNGFLVNGCFNCISIVKIASTKIYIYKLAIFLLVIRQKTDNTTETRLEKTDMQVYSWAFW